MRFFILLPFLVCLAMSPSPSHGQARPPGGSGGSGSSETASSWNGRWAGAFGARSDIVVTITAGKVASVTLLGQPLTVATSAITGDSATMSGPDFSLSLKRVAPGSAQGTYENNRKERATALLTRN